MPEDFAVSVHHLSKDFKLPHEQKNSIKEHVMNFRKQTYERLHALNDINFDVRRGEFFGIVGRNGSGKSTLLKIIGGIYQPTKGSLHVNGTLTPFIELGIGFNPELTGKDNIFLNGAILGLTRKEIVAKYDEIVAFAELEKFMDQKLKNYSSGMQVRLAFSIAMQAHNDILLIDEVLAVGDAAFQRKCFEKFKEIKQSGKTVIFVSHAMDAVREYCDRAVLIEGGNIIAQGDPSKVANDYLQLFNERATRNLEDSARWGDGLAEIANITIKPNEKSVSISCDVTANKFVEEPLVGIIIKNLDGQHIFESNNKWKKIKSINLELGQKFSVIWEVPNVFKTGKYVVTLAAAHKDGFSYYDWREDVAYFTINRPEETAGIVYLEDKMTFKR